jgi:hypothetical protein
MFSPIATLIVGLIVGYIAWQQWQVSKAKLRLDLFDRRYKVYDATRKFLAVIMREATFSDSQLFEFYAGTSDAEFLFDADIVDYLSQITKHAIDMRSIHARYQSLPIGDERSKQCDAEQEHLLWLTRQITASTKTFSRYLSFSNVR